MAKTEAGKEERLAGKLAKGEKIVTTEEMSEEYDRLSSESAQRLLGYWQACMARQQLPN